MKKLLVALLLLSVVGIARAENEVSFGVGGASQVGKLPVGQRSGIPSLIDFSESDAPFSSAAGGTLFNGRYVHYSKGRDYGFGVDASGAAFNTTGMHDVIVAEQVNGTVQGVVIGYDRMNIHLTEIPVLAIVQMRHPHGDWELYESLGLGVVHHVVKSSNEYFNVVNTIVPLDNVYDGSADTFGYQLAIGLNRKITKSFFVGVEGRLLGEGTNTIAASQAGTNAGFQAIPVGGQDQYSLLIRNGFRF